MNYYDEGGNKTYGHVKPNLIEQLFEFKKKNEPIRRGCSSQGSCFCTGRCQEIIGWREKVDENNLSDIIKKIMEGNGIKEKQNTIKIAEPEKVCNHRSHNPPSHRVYSPGTWQHTCPGCGNIIVFTIQPLFF